MWRVLRWLLCIVCSPEIRIHVPGPVLVYFGPTAMYCACTNVGRAVPSRTWSAARSFSMHVLHCALRGMERGPQRASSMSSMKPDGNPADSEYARLRAEGDTLKLVRRNGDTVPVSPLCIQRSERLRDILRSSEGDAVLRIQTDAAKSWLQHVSRECTGIDSGQRRCWRCVVHSGTHLIMSPPWKECTWMSCSSCIWRQMC
eukprot:jgi/Ulvmu1/12432/UM009_0083.1